MRPLLRYQKVRFALVGSTNTLLDFSLFNLLLLLFHIPAVISNVITVSICITLSYALNHYFVFKHKTNLSLKSFKSFILVTGFSSLVIQTSVIWLYQVSSNTFTPIDSHIAAIGINTAKVVGVGLGMVWNFTLYKYVIFKGKANNAAESQA